MDNSKVNKSNCSFVRLDEAFIIFEDNERSPTL